ncbi:MAG: hypothetical protein NT006_11235 [Candidatus Aminicenantes bacterium]|nr:hypothetical protein [Candidatus Aminicenantes bacterium]
MANQKPLDDLDKKPPAADEGGKGFDDMALAKFLEKFRERSPILIPGRSRPPA